MSDTFVLSLSDGKVEVFKDDQFIQSSKLLTTMLNDLVSQELADWELVEAPDIPLKNVSLENFNVVSELLKDKSVVESFDMWDTAHMLNICNFLDMEELMDVLIKRWIDLAGHLSDKELQQTLSTDIENFQDMPFSKKKI